MPGSSSYSNSRLVSQPSPSRCAKNPDGLVQVRTKRLLTPTEGDVRKTSIAAAADDDDDDVKNDEIGLTLSQIDQTKT